MENKNNKLEFGDSEMANAAKGILKKVKNTKNLKIKKQGDSLVFSSKASRDLADNALKNYLKTIK